MVADIRLRTISQMASQKNEGETRRISQEDVGKGQPGESGMSRLDDILCDVKPYYRNEWCAVIHGDCQEILPKLGTFDLLLTDPPYGIGWVASGSRRKNPDDFGKMANDDKQDKTVVLLKQAIMSIRPHCHAYIFGDWKDKDLPLGGVCELIWDKRIMSLSGADTPWAKQHEPIMFGVRCNAAQRRMNDGAKAARLRKGTVLSYTRKSGAAVTRHPTEKPVMLLRELVESSSRFGWTVLDPFCGSGSTLEACQLELRFAVGIEIDEKYCEASAKRLEGIVKGTSLEELEL
jgi:site-specific DNA-methyltransferase (adenine-specific)